MKFVTVYLHFNGDCREAMQFYRHCLGAELELTAVMDRHGKPSVEPNARIMHSKLLNKGQPILQASDDQSGNAPRQGDNFQVAIECQSPEEVDRIFAALSEGGKVRFPVGTAPWGARFGMLTDKYGVQWLLNCHPGNRA